MGREMTGAARRGKAPTTPTRKVTPHIQRHTSSSAVLLGSSACVLSSEIWRSVRSDQSLASIRRCPQWSKLSQ
jgi:hypothetical protein